MIIRLRGHLGGGYILKEPSDRFDGCFDRRWPNPQTHYTMMTPQWMESRICKMLIKRDNQTPVFLCPTLQEFI
jgi:hypothetical protein